MAIESAAEFVRMTRGALAAAGFVRHERDGAVWWESPVPGGWASRPPGGAGGTPALHKPTFVLLHGANDHAGTWFLVAPALAQRHRVILPDLAGHGESDPRSGPIPISLIVDRLAAIIGGETSITLLGNSLGGWIALLYALRHPDRVSRLFLEASGGLARPLPVPLVARNRDEAAIILRAVHGPRYEAPEWVVEALLQRATDSPMLRLTETLEHDVEPRLGQLRVPTTLLWGADDGVVPLAYGEELRAAIPGATLRVIEGAAHIPHMQQPQRFLECLTAIS